MLNFKRKNPHWLASVLGNMTKIAGKQIACGFPAGKCQNYPETGELVAEVAAKNCFGIGVPQRDFMSFAKPLIIQSARPVMITLAREITIPGHDAAVEALMENAGQLGASAIKEAIVTGDYVPNSQATIAKKGTGKQPLIDTSHMERSVTYTVRDV